MFLKGYFNNNYYNHWNVTCEERYETRNNENVYENECDKETINAKH